MNNLEELFIANAELAAELLQHMADNEIDSDYFEVYRHPAPLKE
ncbi:hypothetical protein ACS8A1_13210 [Yersinia enterocolitica]